MVEQELDSGQETGEQGEEGSWKGAGIGGMTETKYECGYLLSGIVNFSVWRTVPHERHK